jgi:hypothetical protein
MIKQKLVSFCIGTAGLVTAGTLATSLPAAAISYEWDVNLIAGSYSAVGNVYTSNNNSDGVLNSEIVDWSIDLRNSAGTQFTLNPGNTLPLAANNSDNSLVIQNPFIPKNMILDDATQYASFTIQTPDGANKLFFGDVDGFGEPSTQITIGGLIESRTGNFGDPFVAGGDAVGVPFEFSPTTGLAFSLGLLGFHKYQKQRKQKAIVK